MALPQGRSYGVFQGNIPLLPGDYLIESAQSGITATAGGGQANAFQISTQTTRINTVATAGDSVKLPPAVPGLELMLTNRGLNPMQVYGSNNPDLANAIDTIDGQATTAGVSQMQNSLVIYTCSVTGLWETEGLSTGFSPSLGLQTMLPAVVAANTTNTQAAGTAIKSLVNVVTATSNPGAVTLPVSTPGLCIVIALATAGDAVSVYPNAGGTGTEAINAIAANSAISMAALSSATFVCAVAGQWYTMPRVPS